MLLNIQNDPVKKIGEVSEKYVLSCSIKMSVHGYCLLMQKSPRVHNVCTQNYCVKKSWCCSSILNIKPCFSLLLPTTCLLPPRRLCKAYWVKKADLTRTSQQQSKHHDHAMLHSEKQQEQSSSSSSNYPTK